MWLQKFLFPLERTHTYLLGESKFTPHTQFDCWSIENLRVVFLLNKVKNTPTRTQWQRQSERKTRYKNQFTGPCWMCVLCASLGCCCVFHSKHFGTSVKLIFVFYTFYVNAVSVLYASYLCMYNNVHCWLAACQIF